MLFVSGLMGPYMGADPGECVGRNVVLVLRRGGGRPWLMLKLAPKGEVRAAHAPHDEGRLGRLYRRFATPIVRSKRSAWIFLLGVGIATLLSMTLRTEQ